MRHFERTHRQRDVFRAFYCRHGSVFRRPCARHNLQKEQLPNRSQERGEIHRLSYT